MIGGEVRQPVVRSRSSAGVDQARVGDDVARSRRGAGGDDAAAGLVEDVVLGGVARANNLIERY